MTFSDGLAQVAKRAKEASARREGTLVYVFDDKESNERTESATAEA